VVACEWPEVVRVTGRHLQRLLPGNYPAVMNEYYGDIENRVAF
jgi:hypothetical protein